MVSLKLCRVRIVRGTSTFVFVLVIFPVQTDFSFKEREVYTRCQGDLETVDGSKLNICRVVQGAMAEEIKRLFEKNRVQLAENIVLDCAMWNHLRADEVLSAAQRDRIELNKTRDEQIGSLLDFLVKRPDEAVISFCEALRSTNQKHIVDGLLTPSGPTETSPTSNLPGGASQLEQKPEVKEEKTRVSSADSEPKCVTPNAKKAKLMMTEDHKQLLRINREKIIENLDLNEVVWGKLVEANIILDDIGRSIQENYEKPQDQVAPFLAHFIRRPDNDFLKFCEILKDCGQNHIVIDCLTPE